ncbi:MAG: hypothetical protein ABS45_09815 [Comamonas sp. SCN 65-56]|jgi:putative secretion ATPase (PEP-CTERM system associated)|uniref:XrtA/PEP-CTERM system-associated ATPase n=1 Tax=Comamonas sp. SCN 65-56 TaxID=1660095 RepID=UPI00086A0FA9|nr:XrtA/PEP-CTERM system-associated ATPase [Comamonas sp. SCN 65-56]ODS91777.1 MAG: hypothetical protein ABS45_09815 [Comamonas sp. SCN 65-56]GIK82833.1 MAG: ATPase [Alphaproteobacteria bacterium]
MYESFFKLTGKPFQLSPDPDFYFGSRGHRRAMAYLEYGLHQGEGFIVVTGEIGAGKTTLVRKLLRTLPGDRIVPVQIVTTQLDEDNLLRLVAASFGLQADADKSATLIRLEQFLQKLNSEGRRALLIVDEAQNLGPRAVEELRMLSNFQIGPRSGLQTFLIGQPELRDLMQRPEMRQLKQRIVAAYHLGPLDEQETRRYVEHRLAHVGWCDDPAFDDAVFARIHALTSGIPRRINLLADRLLLLCFLGQSHRLTVEMVDEVADELALEVGPRAGFMRHAGDEQRANASSTSLAPVEDARMPLADASLTERLKSVEERLSLLESTIAVAYQTLKRLVGDRGATPGEDSTGP